MDERIDSGGRRRLVRVIQIAAAVLAVAGLAAWGYFGLLTIGVSVDGKHHRLPSATTVGDLLERKIVVRRSGDLVSAKGHRVLTKGAGGRPYLTDGNRTLTVGETVLGSGQLVSHDGTDTIEKTRVTTEAIDPPTEYRGAGPIETTVETGTPGVREITWGVVSKQAVRKREVTAPVPRVVARRGLRPGDKTIALTFDDGPWPGSTKEIVSILKKNHVTATFFMIGRQARKSPALARAVTKAGMAVGNHTDTHSYGFGKMNESTVYKEISYAQHDIRKATGQTPKVFRPPGGIKNKHTAKVLKKFGMTWALWTIDTGDWKRPSAGKITSIATKNARPGAVILMHDGGGDRSSTVKALPGIIKKLRSKGYSFVTLDALSSLPHTMG
jgi:peptidoglycan/xylan/chitin deacetylase (PgdA/CDA1 family)